MHAQARTRTGAAAKVEGAAATQAVDTAAADTAAVTSDQWASAVAASSVAAAAALAATAKPNPKEGNVLFKRKRPAQDAASSAGRPRTAPPPAPPAAAAVADAVRPLRAGDRVLARYGAASGEAVALTKWFPGAISVAHEGGACDVAYDDGDFEVVIVSSHSK